MLSEKLTKNTRAIYSLMSFLGDIGGFQQSYWTLGYLANWLLLTKNPSATILNKFFKTPGDNISKSSRAKRRNKKENQVRQTKNQPESFPSVAEQQKWLKQTKSPDLSWCEQLRQS